MGFKEEIPRGGPLKARRINLILDSLGNGLHYEEIQLRLNNDRQGFYGDFRGECSVTKVERVINLLPLTKYHINDVIEIPRYSYEDRVEKHDLEIFTDDQQIGVIGVQVKSRNASVSKFYRHFDRDLDIAKQIAIQKKLIVLNGSLDNHIIERNFLDQLHAIQEYHQGQS